MTDEYHVGYHVLDTHENLRCVCVGKLGGRAIAGTMTTCIPSQPATKHAGAIDVQHTIQ